MLVDLFCAMGRRGRAAKQECVHFKGEGEVLSLICLLTEMLLEDFSIF